MECEERGEQKVLPVLYKVKPYEVRELKGAFGEAFESRKDRFDEKVKQQGPVALRKALDLRVFESEKFANGHEAELIKELVRVIMDEQRHNFLPPLPGNLVGIEDRVAEVMKLVSIAHPDTRIIWIWGIGGIGKTTLATSIYNKLVDKFQCRSFLKDIEETIRNKGIEHVQSRLISDTLEIHDYVVRDPDTGINNIQFNCAQKKVLLVLDNVGHPDHLNMLIGGCKFRSGSRIIVTSHMAIKCLDKAMSESTYLYELKEMDYVNSLLLFSIHAFEGKPPPKELVTLFHDIVATTRGHPLALKVIGSLLKEKEDQRLWRETLKELSKAPHMTVQQKLKVSYDELKYKEQQMFLDIACFLVGTDQRIATYLWDDLGFSPISGLARMVELLLIKFDEENEENELTMHQLRMHDQLRDLGRAIAHPVDKKPWEWSRLWDEEATKVIGRKEENEIIEALCLDERGSREFIKQESFKKMPNLKFLHVKDMDFDGNFEGSLAELRWLKWERCRDSFEATNFYLEKLVVLDLSGDDSCGSGISENWRGWSSIKMERLKVLNLSHCRLCSIPNLSAFKNLEMLILEYCTELEEIDPSIRDVKCLVSLKLDNCWSLKNLPEQLGELEKLEELVVSNTKIKEFPPCIGSLKKLKRLSGWGFGAGSSLVRIPSSIGKLGGLLELNLSFTSIKELPESIGELNKLKILKIFYSDIKRLPSSIGQLRSLQELLASNCKLEGQILVDKGGLSSLKTLNLKGTKISSLPENLHQFSSLECLELLDCDELESLPKPPCSLSFVRLTCRSNELPSLSHLKHLQELYLWDCKSLQSIPELPSCIRMLHVVRCPKLERLSILFNLEFLSKLCLAQCSGLKKLFGLEALKYLKELQLDRLLRLSNLVGFDEKPDDLDSFDEKPDDLNDFDKKLHDLHAIEGLEKLRSLEVVDISARKHIQVLDLSKSEHLKKLIVRNCKSFVKIRCPSKFLMFLHMKDVDFDGDFEGSLTKLRWLNWERCHDSFKATNFHLEKLVILDLSGDHNDRGSGISENWRGWSSIKMERLKVLNLSHCCLWSIPNLSAFKNLEMLSLYYCTELEEIDPSIRDVKCLVSLNLDGCWSLKKLPEQLDELEKFEKLVVSHTGIEEIPHIGSLKKLKRLSTGFGPGPSIVQIPSSIGKLGELLELDLSFTSINELLESIGELNKLKILKIVMSNIERLPSSIGKLQSLQELLASMCKLEGQIFFDKGGLSSLKTLDLSYTKISGLPENLDQPSSLECLELTCRSKELLSLSHLKHLQELHLWNCGSLQSIPELPSCIRTLDV